MKKTALFVLTLSLIVPTLAFASIDTNLSYGTHGTAVVELQNFLIQNGFLTGTTATGNFFSLTKKAVVAYQASVGLPTTGFVGALTRAKINAASVAPTASTGTTTSTATTTQTLSTIVQQLQQTVQQQAQTIQQIQQNTQQIAQNTTPVVPPPPAPVVIDNSSASVTAYPSAQAELGASGGTMQATIGEFKVNGYGEGIKVSSLSVLPVMGIANCLGSSPCAANMPILASGTCVQNVNCSLENVTVWFGSEINTPVRGEFFSPLQQIASTYSWSGSGALTFNFASPVVIPVGNNIIEIHADMQNASLVNYTGGTFVVNLESGAGNAQGESSHTTLDFPSSDVAGEQVTIQ